MNNSRNQTCRTRNTRTNSSACCAEQATTYNNSGCDCYSKSDGYRDMTLAMAYVPWQQFGSVLDPDKALQMGTLFPELIKPYQGCKGGHC